MNMRFHRSLSSKIPSRQRCNASTLQRFNASRIPRKSEIANRKSSGVALVITLILLSVTLVMAIAFLAISRRERNSVTIVADQTAANNAASAALFQCEGQIVSQIQVTTNPYVFSLLVSTNFINQNGFTNGSANLANVNYDHYVNSSTPLSAADFQQNIANLFYSPRVPVFYSNDFRFYLDLNRNGRYDTNGVVTNLDNENPPQGLGTVSLQVGDPEWIGVLEHPDQPHGPNNRFIARYCFIAVPANTLDLNHIHNQALDYNSLQTVNPLPGKGNDDYWRNQGVGSWEINLAAFLTDLNTDRWDTSTEPYSFPEGQSGRSTAFDDARALVAWRYNLYPLLDSAKSMFSFPGNTAFLDNGIDSYSVGLQTNFDANYSAFYIANNFPKYPWLGAVNTNDFFSSPSDLFNTNKTSAQFATNLVFAGVNNSTYDRYTFYRMLSQLGTDSPRASGKLNLNYQNVLINYDFNAGDISRFGTGVTNVATGITIVPDMETNFVQWKPHDFFTAAANQLLHAYSAEWFEASPSNYVQTYYGITEPYYTNLDGVGITNIQYYGQTNQIPSFGLTNIPVYVNNTFVYSPAVNRLLQLAANMYDATTNTSTLVASNYPSVFRPIFWVTNEYSYVFNQYFTNVYIKGYQYVYQPLNVANANLNGNIFVPPVELNDPSIMSLALQGGGISTSNIWGIPWIIGAKKGLPNFNGLEIQNCCFVERKLQFNRANTNVLLQTTPIATVLSDRNYTVNQMYLMGISNVFGIEDWNSYAESYNNPVMIEANDTFSFGLSNDAPGYVAIGTTYKTNNFENWTEFPWPGRTTFPVSASFVLPLGTNIVQQPLNPTWISATNLYVYYYGPGSATFSGVPFNGPCYVPTYLDPSNYMDKGTPPLPHIVMQTTNHLQAWMLDTRDTANPYLLDYVQLGNMNNGLDINQAVADNSIVDQYNQPYTQGLWSTNYAAISDLSELFQANTPYGVVAQYYISQGAWNSTANNNNNGVPPEDMDGGGWANTTIPGTSDTGPAAQQAFFLAFFSPVNEASYPKNGKNVYVQNLQTSVQAPYTPTRLAVQRLVYLANDPLVHALTQDLYDIADTTNTQHQLDNPPLGKLGAISDRYMPWGTQGNMGGTAYNGIPPDGNKYNLSYKDPGVYSSDNWDFPTNKYPTVGWLGRVHRGTPWQSVFLKSTNLLEWTTSIAQSETYNAGYPTWQIWTGNANADDAFNASPAQDRLLFDLFTATPIDDATRGQLNVNIGADDPTNMLAGLASWSALLSGTLVFSNNLNDFLLNSPNNWVYEAPDFLPGLSQDPPNYTIWTNQPVGAVFNWPGIPPNITSNALWQIVEGINSTRTNFVGIDGLHGVFEHAGDILAVPQLSDASPFLRSASLAQQEHGISDEMYEWLPQQVLPLLTVSGTPQSPPRYVIYCYGQALRPAVNGIVQGGTFFGMCTNYQVVAESASRAVIRIENVPSPVNPNGTPKIVVEQFNPLPPD